MKLDKQSFLQNFLLISIMSTLKQYVSVQDNATTRLSAARCKVEQI